MVVFDTDHASLLDRSSAESALLRSKLAMLAPDEVVTTIVTIEEQTRGWLNYLARARSIDRLIGAYTRFRRHLDDLPRIPILDFDDAAAEQFRRLNLKRIRLASMDLHIAAIVLSRGATLLTRNHKDFGRVPELRIEDWTR